jgi:hypothetical protein
MRIDQLTKIIDGDLVRISGTVTWEDCDRPSLELYLSTFARFQDDVSCNPNAFLLAAIIPAMHWGEKRIVVQGKVCPQLRNGLDTALQILRHWYGKSRHIRHCPVVIEATQGFEAPCPRVPPRTASTMSGGVDSLATLRLNRRDFPRDHPASISDCMLVSNYGWEKPNDLAISANEMEEDAAFLSELAEREDLTVIPVDTNFRALYESRRVFSLEGGAAHLAAMAHAFPTRFSTLIISSGLHITELIPFGYHPLLDPNYSSSAMAIRHEGCHLKRLEKVGAFANWEVGLRCLRVCDYHQHYCPKGFLNCGRCDKCIRTMLELKIYDKLSQCPTFPADDVTPEMVRNMTVMHLPKDLVALIEPLKQIGRGDLVTALTAKVEDHEKNRASGQKRNWRNVVKQLDRTYLGGHLHKGQRYIKDLLAKPS